MALCTNTNTIWRSSHAVHFFKSCEGHNTRGLALGSERLLVCGYYSKDSTDMS